jgi:signal transduction histidine kinase
MKKNNMHKLPSREHSNFIRLYFIIGSIIIIIFFVIYSNSLLHSVRKQLEVFPTIYAKFLEASTKENMESELLEIILTEVIQKIDYPIVVTNEYNTPKFWKNIPGIPPTDSVSWQNLSQEEKIHFASIIEEMDGSESSIILQEPETEKFICKVIYSESPTMARLRFLPYFEFLVLILFIAIGVLGIVLIRRREKESLWVALAKETAHQFGTPITSLLGWIEMLRDKIQTGNITSKEINEISEQMKLDLTRLQNIASRFGKVGSSIKPRKTSLKQTVDEIIDYFSPRLPKENHQLHLNFIQKTENDMFYFDPDLLKWALENLIKNSIDSMSEKSGNIFIIAHERDQDLYIQIKDEGIGIPKKLQNYVFSTGVTTKPRGWGLGLSLAKRIIEEFHNGKIYILESSPQEGTTIEIKLPQDKIKKLSK